MRSDLFQSVRRDGATAVGNLEGLSEINIKNESGQNLLHVAIAYGNGFVIRPLLDSGIDVNASDSKGQTPLHYAAAHGNAEVAEQVLAKGADLSCVDTHGNSPVWTAVFNARGKYGVVELLIRHGGREYADTKNKHGKSPLDFARQIGDATLISMLEG